MFHEEVKVKSGNTISGLAVAYGYKASDWQKVWDDPLNKELVDLRGTADKVQVDDVVQIPIPWKVVSKSLAVATNGVDMIAERDGELGQQLSWVQTVYQHNQPAPLTGPFCVDGCPADDNLPFYWTNPELSSVPNLRKRFEDSPQRAAPPVTLGTTTWRAILSLAAVTEQRVTVWNSLVWGFDITPLNAITAIGPRDATAAEVTGHIQLLGQGNGTGPLTFAAAGWTFRKAP